MEPPVSVPVAAKHKSAETADADPPEDPPGDSFLLLFASCHGFTTSP